MASSTLPEPVIGGGGDMSETIMELVQPTVCKLDEQIKNTRKSQLLLANQIDVFSNFLKQIADDRLMMPYDLESYVSKMDESRKRVLSLSTRLHNIHDRMSQIQRGLARESFKKKQELNKTTENS